jgi:hypothetical protein
VFMLPAVAVHNVGVGSCRGDMCGDMLEAMARITHSQPNEAMARVAPRSPIAPMVKFHSTQASYTQVLWARFEIVLEGSNRFKKRIELNGG